MAGFGSDALACYHPLAAFRTAGGEVVFAERGDIVGSLSLACGQCVGCRLERSRQWAVRCMHEAALWEHNCFVTLTYDDDHIPAGNSLCYSDFQKFVKRVRRRFSSARARFYMAGEYGEEFGRPHYHACFFDLDFPDKLLCSRLDGSPVYRSAILERLWPYGFSSIGEVNFKSAAYVARYVMKKVTGASADCHYEWIDQTTGEIFARVPEFNRMSLKPGIGAGWIDRFMSDVYPHGQVVVNGVECKPPRYYDKRFGLVDAIGLEQLQYSRDLYARAHAEDSTERRLLDREIVTDARVGLYRRSIK